MRSIGLVGRCLEHYGCLVAAKREKGKTRQKLEKKYMIMKKVPLEQICFVPLHSGTAATALQREKLAIRMCPSELNP